MRTHLIPTRIRFVVRSVAVLLLAAALAGAEPPADEAASAAPQLTVPLVTTPQASADLLTAAKSKAQGLVVNLASGRAGAVARYHTPQPLPAGRYRLHVLVATTPHENLIVDPVEVRLTAGKNSESFTKEFFPTPGELAELTLDFNVSTDGDLPLAVDWWVGDSMIDRQLLRTEGRKARQMFHAERDLACEKVLGVGQAPALPTEEPSLGDSILEELEEEGDDQQNTSFNSKKLPAYRLIVTGVHLEQLSPVAVAAVRPDKPVYEPGEQGKVVVKLVNHSAEPARGAVAVRLAPMRNPEQEQTLPPQPFALDAGATQEFTLPAPFSTSGLEWGARLTASVSVAASRPAEGTGAFAITPPKKKPGKCEKKVFAHYMGCWPAASGPLLWGRQQEPKNLSHTNQEGAAKYGNHIRNYDLVPPEMKLSATESANLEIRRAMRIGIDGFAIDAWAGGDDARRTLDALFQVAEEKDYPFEITICVDPVTGGNIVGSVKYLLEKHGDSPKLARRDGKPLIFGYGSIWTSMRYLERRVPEQPAANTLAQPLGWHLIGQEYQEAAEKVGTPIFYHYDLKWFFLRANHKLLQSGAFPRAAGVLAQYVDALGGFDRLGKEEPEIAKAVIENGAEWASTVGMYQKENIPYECYMPLGTERLSHAWHLAMDTNATLLQIVTWNDYGENTNIAPAFNSRYTQYDLTGYYIKWWKTGKPPEPDHDRIYLTYAKYPRSAKTYPFPKLWSRDRRLEVLTILTKPGKIRLPGRDIEYEAPAGLHRAQFPLAAGPVIAELVRNGQVEKRLESPEPITDRPFRVDDAMVCYSTEFERYWKEDFGDREPWHYSEYGDLDSDGLPNWFEMYWFSKERGFQRLAKPPGAKEEIGDLIDDALEEEGVGLGPAVEQENENIQYSVWGDFSTATYATPEDDPDGDGKTNLEEYLAQTDPTKPHSLNLDVGKVQLEPGSGQRD